MLAKRCFWLALGLLPVCGVCAARAQEKAGEEEAAAPVAEAIDLTTDDEVALKATYYPGTKGKNSVAVVLLHGHKGGQGGFGSQADYKELAPFLQSLGYAVVVPDLRGHGGSTVRKGLPTPISARALSRMDYARMASADMLAVKRFLVRQNNEGKLNIEKLCLVGAEMGASVALHYAYLDWSLPPIGIKKQGQDVKALVLISPEVSTPGLPLQAALSARPLRVMIADEQLKKVFKDPDAINFRLPVDIDYRNEVAVMIVVGGNGRKEVGEAKQLQRMLKPFHPEVAEEERATKQDLFYGALDTSLQGTQMLGKNLGLEKHIASFIELRVAKRSFPWAERRDPYSGSK